MNQMFSETPSLLAGYGTPQERVKRAVAALQRGEGILVVDDEDRENEGDFIFAADSLTDQQMALMIREGSGIVCLVLTGEQCDRLNLPPMVAENTSRMGTGFTVSIEAAHGVTTGVSAADRVTTVKAAINPQARPQDLARPGHMFPLRAHPGGVLARAGHTEASLDLVRMAGRAPAAVLCELTNPDGTMARLPEVIRFARGLGMPVMTIADLQLVLRDRQAAA